MAPKTTKRPSTPQSKEASSAQRSLPLGDSTLTSGPAPSRPPVGPVLRAWVDGGARGNPGPAGRRRGSASPRRGNTGFLSGGSGSAGARGDRGSRGARRAGASVRAAGATRRSGISARTGGRTVGPAVCRGAAVASGSTAGARAVAVSSGRPALAAASCAEILLRAQDDALVLAAREQPRADAHHPEPGRFLKPHAGLGPVAEKPAHE